MTRSPIMVSIICNVFNHEKYIRKCLDGFVMQKTDFPFEVLVHDDASTDSSADIIREYEAKYPEIIKPIYETENQYSKHDGSLYRIQHDRITGKYVAFCEGDDFWTDENKLQKQYDALEAHPEVDMCAHAAAVLSGGERIRTVSPKDTFCVIPTEEVIIGDGGYVATNSLMYRKSLEDVKLSFREFYRIDYSLQILGSLRGGLLYIPEEMSVYNYMTEGSWSRQTSKNKEQGIKNLEKISKMLEYLNEDTEHKYEKAIEYKLHEKEYQLICFYGPYRKIMDKKFKPLRKQKPISDRIKLFIKFSFPFMFKEYR